MKSIIPFLLLAMLSCNNKKETMRMPGAYNMLSASVFDGEKDTTYTTLKEFKIYTYDYMMYVNISPKDSVSRFGIGSYSSDSGRVIESIIYGATDSTSSSNPASFTLVIEKTELGYKQVIPELISRGKKYRLTEDYETVSADVKTPLDGAWKLTRAYRIAGNDTVIHDITQFKTYFAGHFMFGHTYRDSTNRHRTGIGYGSFELHDKDKLTGRIETTTYQKWRGKDIAVNVDMNGSDAHKETITNADGTMEVEEYQRLKK